MGVGDVKRGWPNEGKNICTSQKEVLLISDLRIFFFISSEVQVQT